MGVYDAPQMSNSPNVSNSTSMASFGERSQTALIFFAWERVSITSKTYVEESQKLTFSLNLTLVPRSISAFAKPNALPNCLFLFAKFMAENKARV